MNIGPTNEKSFYEARGELPWLENEPRNSGECVEWQKSKAVLPNVWVNIECDKAQKVLCRKELQNIKNEEANGVDLIKILIIIAYTFIFVVFQILIHYYIKSLRLAIKLESLKPISF